MISSLDHLVLTVRDMAATCAFYEALGMQVRTFGAGRTALHFGSQKINLHPLKNDVGIVAAAPTAGSADLCLILSVPVAEAERRLRAAGIAIEAGPVQRTGATGPIMSLYVRDPDGNLIEVSEQL
jgi:catechol 2,3-dioxygenase-like lactoylglutathione lyase family enzyme